MPPRKKERSKINDIIFHLKKTEKEQHDPKTHRRENNKKAEIRTTGWRWMVVMDAEHL